MQMEYNNIKPVIILVVLSTTLSTYSTSSVLSNSTTNKTAIDSFNEVRNMLINRLNSRLKVPPKYYRAPTSIMLLYEPFQIITVDEISQSITVSCIVTLTWRDHNIGWQPKDFQNIERIKLPTSLFWTPSVLVPKTIQKTAIELQMPETLDAVFEGYVTAVIPGFTNTLCNLDMTRFPFDSHNCTIIFLDGERYNVTSTSHFVTSKKLSKYFDTNAAWVLLDHNCNTILSRSYVPRFEYVACNILMRRRSAFFVANLITPIVLTSVMTLLVFWIPAETEEKISFLVSMFTSSFVFLNYMIDMIPRSMESLPKMNLLVFAIEVLIILATVATAFVLRRYTEDRKMGKLNKMQQREQNKNKIRTPNVKPQHHGSIVTRTRAIFKPIDNIVHPEVIETQLPVICDSSSSNNSNNIDITDEISNKVYCDSGNIVKQLYEHEQIPQHSLHISLEDVGRQSKCLGCRRLTHEELDKLFFIILFILTVAIYIFAFLDQIVVY